MEHREKEDGLVTHVRVLIVVAFLATQGSPSEAAEDLAKQSQNPIGNMISLPMQNNTYFGVGPSDEWANSFQLQPVYPINFGAINLINRAIIPFNHIESQEVTLPAEGQLKTETVTFRTDDATGLGNITYQGFLSPAQPGKLVWGVGPVLQMPTNTDDQLGTDNWSAGPGAVALAMPGKWVLGCLAYNIWDFAGDNDESDVNSLLFQYFINYNIKNGWYLTSTPVITANWEADEDERWTVPFGLGVGRLIRIGKQPIDIKVQPFVYAEKPTNGPDWSLQFQVKLLFPK
jgi:hypothetical protein